MKAVLLPLLLASLSVNALWWFRPVPPGQSVPPAAPVTAVDSNRGPEAASPRPKGASVTEVEADVPLRWTDVPTGDLQALADHLRERGVPPHIIRGIVGHYLGEEYRTKRKDLQSRMRPYRYWEGTRSSSPEDLNLRAELRNLAREQNNRLNALAGTEEPAFDLQSLSYVRQRYGNLPADKIVAVQAIESDYNELTSQVRQAAQGVMLAQDREALALLEHERRKDFQAILTPAEFEEFELRTSNTGSQLRRNLHVMQPTEAEFRTLFALQRPFDEKYMTSSAPRSRESLTQRQAEERELIAAAKAALGPERGAEYEKARDYNYVHAHSVAQSLGLPKETGDKLWNVQKEAMQQFNRIGTDSTLNSADKAKRQQEHVQAVRAALIAEVGADNLSVYEQGGGGWLKSLETAANRSLQRPPTPAPAGR
jgi:hypothetical protein